MRLLPERPDHDCQGAARSDAESDRRTDSPGHVGHAVSLHDVLPHPGGHQARGESHGQRAPPVGQRGDRMTTTPGFTRRDFIKASGYLVVGVAAAAHADFAGLVEAQTAGPYPDPDFKQLDSW